MTEIDKLEELFKVNNLPYELGEIKGTKQIFYPDQVHRQCDVVCHSLSYGGPEGLLEIMWDTFDVEGNLTAEEVFKKISRKDLTN